MNKTFKTILIAIAVIAFLGGMAAGFFITRHNKMYISKAEAAEIAIADAGVTAAEIIESDVDFESNKLSAWYEVDFETHSNEYGYSIDAVSGDILNSHSEPNT